MQRTAMLVLMMGRTPDHAVTSFLRFLPRNVVLVTTPSFATAYRRRLPHWKKRYDFDGWVEVIPEPFTHDAPAKITEAMAGILTSVRMRAAFEAADDDDEGGFEIGITGGTTLMAGLVSALSAIVPGASTHYVIRPPKGQAISPMRDVICLPNRNTMLAMKEAPPQVTEFIIKNSAESDATPDEIHAFLFQASREWPSEIRMLVRTGVLIFDKETGFSIANLGIFASVAALHLSVDVRHMFEETGQHDLLQNDPMFM